MWTAAYMDTTDDGVARREDGTEVTFNATARIDSQIDLEYYHHGGILQMVLRQGAVQLVLGLVLGLGLALVVASVAGSGIQNVLFGVTARDPLTYTVVFTLVTIVSIVATLVPAQRATRVDPMIALRAE